MKGSRMNNPESSGVILAGRPVRSVDEYRAGGGGKALAVARELGPALTVEEVLLSGLRGRGGGGYRTGRKWAAVRKAGEASGLRYVVGNGAEGEPGTFKDRAILRHNPYQVLEGLAIAVFAVGAAEAYLALKCTFRRELEALAAAMQEMAAVGLIGDVPVTLVAGPDSYLLGEEKGPLEVVEGEDPLPRRFPPYIHGLFATGPQMGWSAHPGGGDEATVTANPTLVNNVETLAAVPHILARGAEWYRSVGTWESPGTTVFTVVGDVCRPGYMELALGQPLGQVIERVAGGVRPGRYIKAVFSGVAKGVITAEHLDTPASYEGLQSVGSGLGSAGFIVYDDTADMVSVARMFSRFLYVESCGQCTACKVNSGQITRRLEALERGAGAARQVEQIGSPDPQGDRPEPLLPARRGTVLISSILRAFPDEFVAHLERRIPDSELPRPQDRRLGGREPSSMTSLINHKQPDWTSQASACLRPASSASTRPLSRWSSWPGCRSETRQPSLPSPPFSVVGTPAVSPICSGPPTGLSAPPRPQGGIPHPARKAPG